MRLAKFGYCLSLLAIGGIAFPTPIQGAEMVAPSAPLVIDVMLDAEGSLQGTVVDHQGEAATGVRVSLSTAGVGPINIITDDEGRFRVTGLRGGIYQIAVGERVVVYRVWTPAAAPPGAQRSVMLVIDSSTARGQNPFPDFVRSDAFLITAVIITAIAIPIAIHNFRNDHPSGS
jgi:hypothetical protein